MPSKKIKALNEDEIDRVIRMAWCDRTPFEVIEERTTLAEAEVIELMRTKLKRKSFNIWRARVSGRLTKHRKRFRLDQKFRRCVEV